MTPTTKIKVIGMGGGGQNAVNRMIAIGIEGVEFIAANTDRQALLNSLAPTRILLGPQTQRGLGAGGDPTNGESAAEESVNDLRDALAGADMVFLAAGMGGGTGTGSIAVAARVARELGAITVAIVNSPFMFEGTKRARNAAAGIAKLREHCDSLIVVPNDKLLDIVDRKAPLVEALGVADEVLRQGVQGMAELITRPSLINVDFANVCALMQMPGGAFLAMGDGRGPNKTPDAINQMLRHKLLDADTLTQASGVLVHFTGGEDLTLHEINQAILMIRQAIPEEAQFVMGAMTDETMTGRVQIILVATGVGSAPVASPLTRVETAAGPLRRVPINQPPFDLEPAAPEPAPALVQELFAGVKPASDWVMSQEPTLEVAAPAPAHAPNELDIPAFLRRRRGSTPLK